MENKLKTKQFGTSQKYKCDACGKIITIFNLMQHKDVESVSCMDVKCNGFMFKDGEPDILISKYRLKPDNYFLRPMNIAEAARLIAFKIKTNQMMVAAKDRNTDDDIAGASFETAKEQIEKGDGGVTVDIFRNLQ